ncbi:MAG: C-type lectin domain-containing protein [Myxococcales bacterium]|nr:C-type lectin domain-containing protein [Myxococcales bacterium]
MAAEPSELGPDAGSAAAASTTTTDQQGTSAASAGTADAGTATPVAADLEACPGGQKRCGGLCAAPHPAIGCGLDTCEPCPGLEGGAVVCEAGRCSDAAPQVFDDLPLDTGCPDPFDPATVLPQAPLQGADCGDPRTTDPTTLDYGCCFYGCFHGHHYYSCRPDNIGVDAVFAACRAVGMKVVEINTHNEHEFVSRWGGQHGINAIIIGLTTFDDPNVWRWSTLSDDRGPILYDQGVLTEGAYSALSPSTHSGMPFPCSDCYLRVSGYTWVGSLDPPTTFTDPFVCESVQP